MVSLDETLNCLDLTHTLLKSTPPNVLMFVCDIVMLMEVKKSL
jgi:hypothetical protein